MLLEAEGIAVMGAAGAAAVAVAYSLSDVIYGTNSRTICAGPEKESWTNKNKRWNRSVIHKNKKRTIHQNLETQRMHKK